jgi:hypothetical protein
VAVFIELTTDAFEQNMARLVDKYSTADRAGLSNVRRPLRGVEVKEDTYAMIKVVRADGLEIPLVDSGAPTGVASRTANFIIQTVQEARMEKHQIIETFGEPYIFFFGEAPRFLDVTAILINSLDFNWEAEWWDNWEKRLRGTKSVELGARTYLFYDDSIIEGYMLMAQAMKTSDQPFIVQLTFRMFITSCRNVSFVGDPNYPVQASVNLPPNVSLTSSDAFSQLTQIYSGGVRPDNALEAFSGDITRAASSGFGSKGKLTDALRKGSRSIAFAVDVQKMIDTLVATNAQDLPELDVYDRLTNKPIRGKIADNVDEFTGNSTISPDLASGYLPEMLNPRVRSIQESTDLFLDAVRFISCLGGNVNSYTSLKDMGLGISFKASAGVGIGLGTKPPATATFSPQAPTGIGFAPTVSGLAVARANTGTDPTYGFGTGAGTGTIGGVGAGVGFSASASLDPTSGLDTGFGDPVYGYSSPFGGPGFGRTGFGDFGGLSYGSAFGTLGDPGMIPPDEFTFAGVEDNRDAFKRFVEPKQGYGPGFGGFGADASFAGVGAGAVISVSGSSSAFSVVAVPGTLNPTGTNVDPSINPFGITCGDTFKSVNLLDLI